MKTLLVRLCVVAAIACSVMPSHAGINRFTNISPEGGIISSLVIDPSRPATVYVASYAGVFKSSDEGENWTLVFEPSTFVDGVLVERIVDPMAIDPLRPSTVYVGTNTGEIFKTEDGGATWTQKGERQPSPISGLIVDPSRPETVYALTQKDVLLSIDGGASWRSRTPDTLPRENMGSLTVDPSQSSRVYLGTSHRWLVSHDRGEQWTTFQLSRDVRNFVVDPTSATMYASQGSFLISSRDDGRIWTNFPITYVWQIVVDPLSSAAYALVVESWDKPNRIVKTTDRGLTWKLMAPSLVGPSFLAIDPTASKVFYAASSGDLFRSTTTGESWRPIHHGLRAAYICDIAIDPTDSSTVLVAAQPGVLKSVDAGESWSEQKIDLVGARLSVDSRQPSTIFASNHLAAARSTDRGETWTTINPGAQVRAIAVDPSNSANVYAVLAEGLSRSTDGGSGWSSVDVRQLPLGYYGFDGGAITVHPVTPTTVFAAGGGGIVRSVDSGENWTTVFEDPDGWGFYGLRKLLIDPAKPSTIYAFDYYGVYRSDNDGEDWVRVHSAADPNSGGHFTDLVIDPVHPSRLYLATTYGLFLSFYRGQGWTEINEDLPTRVVNSVAADPAGNVYAGTHRGLFVATVSRALEVPGASTASISLRTHAGNYVSAAGCGGSFVNANAQATGTCETFEIFDLNAGQLNDGDRIHLRADDDGFFVAEGGGRVGDSDALIKANRGVPHAWETFTIRRTAGSGAIRSGDSINLQSMNGTYISADGGGANGCGCDSRLTADRAAAGSWETFVFVAR